MPVARDIILDWLHEDGYSLSEAGWIQARDHKFCFEVTAEKHGIDTSHVRGIGSRRLRI